ncbi:hypothetical protein FACS1894105_13240 [Clostridia bacterium]|nr:hypothetical protein FACS1894105_13240 [Clostridia bacterium]
MNNILDMSQIEFGNISIGSDPFLVNVIVNEVAELIDSHSSKKNITFSKNFYWQSDLLVIGDKLRLSQVLLNILGNAVKFTPSGGKIDFNAKLLDEKDDEVTLLFTVTDTGIGIADEQKQLLFKAFEQGSSNNMKHSGTGLGLAISQALVEMMSGKITVESEPGKGSTFSFTVTLTKAAKTNESDLGTPDLSGKHILCVEDIEINRIVLVEMLQDTNAIIEEAVDGVEAVRMFEKSPVGYYSFIFMDLLMPNMSGHDAARTIRSLDRPDSKTIPIFALSANAYPDDVKQAVESGMNGHIAKPLDLDKALHILSDNVK